MNNIFILAPICFGALVGWLSVYFIRKYKKFNVKTLCGTAGMFISGAGFCSLPFLYKSELGAVSIMYYLLGTSIGFFVHWIYQLIISLWLNRKIVSKKIKYFLLSDCNLPDDKKSNK